MTILNLKKVSSTVTALFCLVSSYTYSLKPLTRRFAATSPTRGEVIKCLLSYLGEVIMRKARDG